MNNNMNIHQMKPSERKLFRYLMRQVNYEKYFKTGYLDLTDDLMVNIKYFIDNIYYIPPKIVAGYIKKWTKIGLCTYEWTKYEDGHIFCIAYFQNLDVILGIRRSDYLEEKYARYIEIVPARVYRMVHGKYLMNIKNRNEECIKLRNEQEKYKKAIRESLDYAKEKVEEKYGNI